MIGDNIKLLQQKQQAIRLLLRLVRSGEKIFDVLNHPTIEIMVEQLAGEERETFHVALLDTQDFLLPIMKQMEEREEQI